MAGTARLNRWHYTHRLANNPPGSVQIPLSPPGVRIHAQPRCLEVVHRKPREGVHLLGDGIQFRIGKTISFQQG